MPFKVVQTIEKGKPLLTTVPDQWELNGTLYWPPRNNRADKLEMMEDSYPDENWTPIHCIVKRRNIPSYKKAELELSVMLNKSDTDSFSESNSAAALEQYIQLPKRKPKSNSIQILESQLESFDDFANICQEENPPPATKVTDSELENIIFVTSGSIETTKTDHPSDTSIIQKLNTLSAAVETLQQNQEKILLKLASVSVQIDEYLKCSIKNKEDINEFQKLQDVDSLENFEELLKNSNIRTEMYNKLLPICGQGKGSGGSNAYILVDRMFSRNLMTHCSWAGGSRTETSKVCFKSFKKTLNLFFAIIHKSDPNFTYSDCETFFKNVMRHSVKRNESSQARASATKRRPKKQKVDYNEQQENSITQESLIISGTSDQVSSLEANPFETNMA